MVWKCWAIAGLANIGQIRGSSCHEELEVSYVACSDVHAAAYFTMFARLPNGSDYIKIYLTRLGCAHNLPSSLRVLDGDTAGNQRNSSLILQENTTPRKVCTVAAATCGGTLSRRSRSSRENFRNTRSLALSLAPISDCTLHCPFEFGVTTEKGRTMFPRSFVQGSPSAVHK